LAESVLAKNAAEIISKLNLGPKAYRETHFTLETLDRYPVREMIEEELRKLDYRTVSYMAHEVTEEMLWFVNGPLDNNPPWPAGGSGRDLIVAICIAGVIAIVCNRHNLYVGSAPLVLA
jgi:hypothetical protein